jgi:hypothetical protein
MASGEVIRIHNVGDTDFVDAFNGRPYRIPANGQLMVDFDAMCLWLGHPDANDFDPRNRVRLAEYERIRSRYGIDARALELSLDKIPFDSDDLFRAMRPKLECFNMAGDRVLTVADDPDGDLLVPDTSEATSEIGLLTARLQAMEVEQRNLRQQLASQQRTQTALDDAQPIGEDINPDSPPPPKDIIGTVTESAPAKAPTPPARTTPSEDKPTRVRVSQT